MGDQGEKSEAPQEEGAPAEVAENQEPVVEEEPEEETLSIEEWEKQQAEKLAALNLNKEYEERTVEKDDSQQAFSQDGVEDQYACMFHDPTKVSKKVSKKGRRGAK